jgi:hypothetical protein
VRDAEFGKEISHSVNTKFYKIKSLGLLDPDDASTTILRNIDNYLTANTA